MAYLPAFLFNFAPTVRHGYQGATGSVAAFICAADPGYLHTSCNAGQERGSKRSRASPLTGSIKSRRWTYQKELKFKYLGAIDQTLAVGVAPFCTYEETANHSLSLLESMAGTTGLEPATSAVTVLHSEVFQRLTNPWGTPKTTEVV